MRLKNAQNAQQPKALVCAPGLTPQTNNAPTLKVQAPKDALKPTQAASSKEGLDRPAPGQKRSDRLTPGPETPQSDQSSWFNGSKLISAFKLTSALVVTGAANAFLFGVPIYVASGIAATVAAAQALGALKIHKEDTPFTQKLMGFTRKVMGREQDLSPAGKEWSMVPVWAGICGLFGLSEAAGNHAYRKWTGYQPKSYEKATQAIQSQVEKSRFAPKRWVLQKQLKGMATVQWLKTLTQERFNHWGQQKGWLGPKLHQLYQSVMKSSGGKRPGVAYLWSFGMASFAGAFQTVLAALMQEKVDRANGIPQSPPKLPDQSFARLG